MDLLLRPPSGEKKLVLIGCRPRKDYPTREHISAGPQFRLYRFGVGDRRIGESWGKEAVRKLVIGKKKWIFLVIQKQRRNIRLGV